MGKLISILVTLLLLVGACGGREMAPQCGDGETYCRWGAAEMCCPPSYPFCGASGTNCPAHKCCTNPPR